MKNPHKIILAICVIFGFVALYLFFRYISIYGWDLSSKHERWAEFGNFFGGVIGTFAVTISAAFVLFNLHLSKREEALSRIKQQENTIIKLYQQYISEEFKGKRAYAWKSMSLAVKDKIYCKYLISRFFPIHNIASQEDREWINGLLYKEYLKDEFIKLSVKAKFRFYLDKKYRDKEIFKYDHILRHSFSDLLNLYNIIASHIPEEEQSKAYRAISETMKKCEFYYDWWRIYLWWLCDLRLSRYYNSPEIQKVSINPIEHLKSLKSLDSLYFPNDKSFDTLLERIKVYQSHPMFKNLFQGIKDPDYIVDIYLPLAYDENSDIFK